MKIDPTKKYQTRDGKPVEFLHRAPEGWPPVYPWRGIVERQERTWDDNGRILTGSERISDLIEVREPLEVRLVVDGSGKIYGFPGDSDGLWYDKSRPDRAPHRIATFREVTP